MPKSFICGCASESLTHDEVSFFAENQPWGLILFKRNCGEPDKVRSLVGHFRQAVGNPDAPVLIDQEGGRVQRLKPPYWKTYPSAATVGRIAEATGEDMHPAWIVGRLIASELYSLGITINCAPVLDLSFPGTTSAIGDRSFGSDPRIVEGLGRAFATGLLAGGVLPVMKHIPGHGRATADSHQELPIVGEDFATLKSDFLPFEGLSYIPIAMVAHVRYSAIDAKNHVSDDPAFIRCVACHTSLKGER